MCCVLNKYFHSIAVFFKVLEVTLFDRAPPHRKGKNLLQKFGARAGTMKTMTSYLPPPKDPQSTDEDEDEATDTVGLEVPDTRVGWIYTLVKTVLILYKIYPPLLALLSSRRSPVESSPKTQPNRPYGNLSKISPIKQPIRQCGNLSKIFPVKQSNHPCGNP